MTKIKVKAIKMVDRLTPGEMDKICSTFGVAPPKGNAKQKRQKLNQLLSTSSKLFKIVSRTDIKSNTKDLYYCFSSDGTFVCTQLELRSRLHSMIIPENIGKIKTSAFCYRERIKLLMQLSLSDENGMVTLPWAYLTANQMVVAAGMFGIKADIKEIRKSPDLAENLPSEIIKSKVYTDQFGISKEKTPLFNFWIDDLETCTGTGLGHEGEDILKLVLPSQKVLQGPALDMSDDAGTMISKLTTKVPPTTATPVNVPSANIKESNNTSSTNEVQITNIVTDANALPMGQTHSDEQLELLTRAQSAPISEEQTPLTATTNADSITCQEKTREITVSEQSKTDRVANKNLIRKENKGDQVLEETPLKNSNGNKRKKDSPIKDSATEVKNGIQTPVSPSLAITKKSKVSYLENSNETRTNHEDPCNVCLSDMSQSRLICLICRQKVHYPCYDSNGSSPMSKEAYEELIMMKTCKWVCNTCNELLEGGQHKLSLSPCAPGEITNGDEEADQIAEAIHDAVKEALNEEIVPLLSNFKISMEKSYAESVKSNKVLPNITHDPATRSQQSSSNNHSWTNTTSKHQLSPEKTVVISNIRDRAIMKSSSSMKCHFNSLPPFKRMKIDFILKDQYGNMLIQFPSEANAKFVLDSWENHFLGSENNTQGTKARPMNRQTTKKPQSTCCIIKQVPHNFCGVQYDDDFISNELNRHLQTPCKVQRFVMKKDGRKVPLTTVKVDLITEHQYEHAINHGVGIGDVHYKVEKLIERPKIMQCYKCYKFGHPSHQCYGKEVCGNCSNEAHNFKDCLVKDPSRFKCVNCNGAHAATSHSCPIYKQRMEQKYANPQHHD